MSMYKSMMCKTHEISQTCFLDISSDRFLTFITVWTNSADGKLMIFFLFFPRKQALTFHADCLLMICMECQSFFWENKKNILPRMLGI